MEVTFPSRRSAWYGLEAEPVTFETALRTLAEENSLRATVHSVDVDQDTACAWLDRGARQCRVVILSFKRNLPVMECQLDELWSFIHISKKTYRGRNSMPTLMAMPGSGWPLHRSGAWPWGLSSGNTTKPA
jgi:Tat protein secretion system quality control protein TatD with DNase activity